MDGGRIVCIGLQAEPVTLVKRAHGRAAHCFRSSSCAHSAYLVVSVEAVFAVFLQTRDFPDPGKKVLSYPSCLQLATATALAGCLL